MTEGESHCGVAPSSANPEYGDTVSTAVVQFRSQHTETLQLVRELSAQNTHHAPDAKEIAAAVREALDGMTIRSSATINGSLDLNTRELIDAAVSTVIYELKTNRDIASSRV